MSDVSPEDRAELDRLDERKWDLYDELAAIDLAKTAILNRIRGVTAA